MSIKIVSDNRKARFEFEVIEVYEAGMVLMGSEVKSLREGSCQLKDAFVDFQGEALYMHKVHIAPYKAGGYSNHEPERKRKLLLHKEELKKLLGKVKERGFTIIPLKVYFKEGKAKVEIGLVKGKKHHDKRDSIKEREVSREMRRDFKRKN